MIGWLIVSAAVLWFFSMKVGIRLSWKDKEAALKIRIGVLRFSLSAKEKKKQKPTGPSGASVDSVPKKPPLKKWIKAVLHHWRELLALISRILRAPALDLLRLHICVGDEEPETCAMNYGKICAVISAGLPAVTNLFPVKKQDINVSCDFAHTETEILAEAELTLRVYEVFVLAGMLLGYLIKIYRYTKNHEKAVQSE